MTMMDQATWDSSVMPGTDADGMSISTELRASTRALDDDGARSSRTETGEAQSISWEDGIGHEVTPVG